MTFLSKLCAAALMLALVTMAAAPLHASDYKLAFVDIQRALNDCHNGKAVKTDFRGRIERLQQRLQGEQDEVERLKKEYEEKGPLMQPDQRQNLEDDYSKKLHAFQDDYKNSADELKQKDQEMTGEIVRDLALVVQRIGAKSNYTMVMEKGSLLWAIPSIDITDEVIRDYDAMNVKPGALAQEAMASSGGGRFGSASEPRPAQPEESAPPSGGSTITK
ncbi:MAG TPA: OmpH family outer membrane protein [Candidatus Binataceae bacterium]|nr:OmpH family outer membrane protein [Candidatus Binataceae bacterium]